VKAQFDVESKQTVPMNAERMLAHAALVNELLFHSPSQIRLVQLICLSGDVESMFILLGWKECIA